MSKPHKIKIGLLGLGTVGSGVYKLIEKQKEEFCKKAGADVEIVKILVLLLLYNIFFFLK